METGVKAPVVEEKKKEECVLDEDVETVMLAAYHKDLGFTTKPRIRKRPSWF